MCHSLMDKKLYGGNALRYTGDCSGRASGKSNMVGKKGGGKITLVGRERKEDAIIWSESVKKAEDDLDE